MLRTSYRLVWAALAAVLLCAPPSLAQGGLSDEARRLLPDQLGDFRATAPAARPSKGGIFERAAPEDFGAVSEAARPYVGPSGESLYVSLIKTATDGGAYSLLTQETGGDVRVGCELGAACVFADGYAAFSKGVNYVTVSAGGRAEGSAAATDLARRLSATLDEGAGGVPVLALHLPEWESVKARADYAVSLSALQAAAGRRPALDALSFEGGAEAATAYYGPACVVVVEFTTPQYAGDNDARVTERIAELRAAGQPVPTAYRREGNYAVFVFDAENEAAAGDLLGQVKYEKDVRWLGRNPNEDKLREEHVTSTMGGVIVGVLKVSGLAILLCLGVGGLFGGAVFLRRRARAAENEVYSDAGGMLRLDLDDINIRPDPSKLLNSGSEG